MTVTLAAKKSPRIYLHESLNDVDEILYGMKFNLRMSILESIRQWFEEAPETKTEFETRKRQYAQWVGLEVLRRVTSDYDLTWGYNTVKKTNKAGRPLLKEYIPDMYLDPALKDQSLARLVSYERRRLQRDLFETGVWVSNEELHLKILQGLWKAYGKTVTPKIIKSWKESISKTKDIPLPKEEYKYSPRKLGHIISYYNIGQPKRSMKERGYTIQYWKLELLLNQAKANKTIDLESYEWLRSTHQLKED